MEAISNQNSDVPVAGRVRVVSLDVDVCDFDSVIKRISKLAKKDKGSYICMSTVHMVMESHDDSEFNAMVNGADIVVPDGMPLVWMQKLQGIRDAGRVRGCDLMIGLFDHAAKKGLRVGFYGGKQEVIDSMLARASVEYPDLKIVYTHSPPFRPLTEAEDEAVVAEIKARSPEILFVGLGCPKQERWMSAKRSKLDAVMIGVGAAFDFYAGNISECPKFLQEIGLEWLFRLSQEPRRLWKRYLFLNPRFVALAVMQLTGLRKSN